MAPGAERGCRDRRGGVQGGGAGREGSQSTCGSSASSSSRTGKIKISRDYFDLDTYVQAMS
jgi:hypothetical protein